MSKSPGGITAIIDCLIIAGFPGIGKTSTYHEMKKSFIGAKVIDMDVQDYGTTNGMNVADPAEYVRKMVEYSHENALILCTVDPAVRKKMQEANLFYATVAPEFPPALASAIPNYRPNPMTRAQYMQRFSNNPLYNSKAGQLLDGRGYEDVIIDLFKDPRPKFVSETLNKATVNTFWDALDSLTRQHFGQNQLMSMAAATPDEAAAERGAKQHPLMNNPMFEKEAAFARFLNRGN